jgi:ribonuclease BN (tRNA processing enzyme)
MKIRILGCSGGIGGSLHTTSLLIDDDILIDAGTGISSLTNEEMAKIRHIFITHTHLDHIACLPLMIDSIFDQIKQPIVIHAQQLSIDALKNNIFNWAIWPNFAELPTMQAPVIRYEPFQPGDTRTIGERTFESIPVNHIVPTVAFRVATANAAMAYSGDTTTNETLWNSLNAHERLDLLIVEVAFGNHLEALCKRARHYSPNLLAADLAKLNHQPPICITHNKPGEEDTIMQECQAAISERPLIFLNGDEVFELGTAEATPAQRLRV